MIQYNYTLDGPCENSLRFNKILGEVSCKIDIMLLAAAMIMILGIQRRAVANAKRSALLALFKCHYFIKLILTLKFFHQFRSFHRTPIWNPSRVFRVIRMENIQTRRTSHEKKMIYLTFRSSRGFSSWKLIRSNTKWNPSFRLRLRNWTVMILLFPHFLRKMYHWRNNLMLTNQCPIQCII